jgi:ubiquinone/menaquinone biosynthesis C-methylase UbiE
MKKEQVIKGIVSFWDQHFENLQPMTITKGDISLDTPLDEYLKVLGDTCEEVLDVACGNGLCLIETKIIGEKIKKGLGFDSSKNAIENAKMIVSNSKIDNLNFIIGNDEYLNTLSDESYDGIFCSNFLDVIPDEISKRVIKNIKRIQKAGGLLLLKFNFYLSADLINKLRMEKVSDNCYAINGVFRANNKTTEEWLTFFPNYEVIKVCGYQRTPQLPEDRLILLRKLH